MSLHCSQALRVKHSHKGSNAACVSNPVLVRQASVCEGGERSRSLDLTGRVVNAKKLHQRHNCTCFGNSSLRRRQARGKTP